MTAAPEKVRASAAIARQEVARWRRTDYSFVLAARWAVVAEMRPSRGAPANALG